jgi:hypothetical protein
MISPQAHDEPLSLPPVLVILMGAILEAVATDNVLTGTLDTLGSTFAATPDGLRACLRSLKHAGWVAVQTEPDWRLTVRLERRSPGWQPVPVERRRPAPDAWLL